MANRNRPQGGGGGRFGRNDGGRGHTGVSPWQGSGPGGGIPNLLPLAANSTEATLALASNIISLLQPRQNTVPSLLDMPIRRDFGPDMGRYDRGYAPNRMGNQGNFRRTGTYNRAGERINTNRKPFRSHDGQRQQNKTTPRKDSEPKAKSESNAAKDGDSNEGKKEPESSEKVETSEEGKKEAPKTRYDDINSQLLKCHICNKSMWDGRSFENHLNGRAHAIMMQKTAESYALTADTMRQEFKIREMKRNRKSGQQPARDFYCAMCDMYAAEGAAHRTTAGHRKLKKFLHPSCSCCRKEMPTRIEWDEHRLTAEHMHNMQDKDLVIKPKPEVMVISTLTMEQNYLRESKMRQGDRRDRHSDKNKQEEDKNGEEGAEAKKDDETNQDNVDEKKIEAVDADNTIIDIKEDDDLSEVTKEMLPAYSTERGVGASFITEFKCYQCKLCRKLLDSAETAEVHLRTSRHHALFVRHVSDKSKHLAQDANKRSRQSNTEEDGNWKRRKTDDEQENGHEEGNEVDDTGNNKYDPGEPDEGDDVEMPAADLSADWEQSVDEILQDEAGNDQGEEEAQSEENQGEEKEEETAPAPVPDPEPAKPTHTPKARRGRRRN